LEINFGIGRLSLTRELSAVRLTGGEKVVKAKDSFSVKQLQSLPPAKPAVLPPPLKVNWPEVKRGRSVPYTEEALGKRKAPLSGEGKAARKLFN